jgi:hypothetical protein
VARLFDDLVGAQQYRRRHFKAERLGNLEIEDKLEFGGLLNRVSCGMASLSNSTLFPLISGLKKLDPVMLPPGRAKLATMPPAIGSPMIAITMGMVVVARLAAAVAGVP